MEINNILWTGGWDSTFRLLDLVLNKKKTVQPYYILDPGRKSTNVEIKTMKKIKSLIYKIDNTAKSRVLDTKMIDLSTIPENEYITKMFNSILDDFFIGKQYEWLGRYAYSQGLNNLELCIHADDKAHIVIKDNVAIFHDKNDGYYKIVENPSNPSLKLFSFYHFPILDLTKLDMDRKAKESGFGHIMVITWFCHSPINGKPCGLCNPCKYTREEGLGRRVPNPTFFRKIARKFIYILRN